MSYRLSPRQTGTGLMLTVVLLAVALASADIPKKINYQGRVTESGTGEPLPGIHSVTFRIYNAVSDGALLWSEQQTARQMVMATAPM